MGNVLGSPVVPALLNGAAMALRPIVTRRDRDQATPFVVSLPEVERAHPVAAAWLIEDKIGQRLLGVARRLARPPRSVEAHVDVVFVDEDTADDALIRDDLAELLDTTTPRDRGESLIIACARRSAFWSGTFDVPGDYSERHDLPLIAEPPRLAYAGRDYVGRSLWLIHAARDAWQHMRHEAELAGITLEAISGFRSIEYQAGIWRRKLARGDTGPQILSVNVPPGYSEHHSGRAIDIGTPGVAPADAAFGSTDAFAWLQRHAHRFGFRMSFPEGNRHGVMYEPWHWYFV